MEHQIEKDDKLIKAYNDLFPIPKCIVKIMGVNINPVSQNNIRKYLNDTGICDEFDKPVTKKIIDIHLSDLKKMGLIINDNGKGLTCPERLLFYAAMDAALHNQFAKILLAITNPASGYFQYGPYNMRSKKDVYRAIQIAVYCKGKHFTIKAIRELAMYQGRREPVYDASLLKIFNHPFPSNLFDTLDRETSMTTAVLMIEEALNKLESVTDILTYIRPFFPLEFDHELNYTITESYLFQGRMDTHEKFIHEMENRPCWQLEAQKGQRMFICDDNESALNHFRKALALYKKETRKRNIFLPGTSGMFFLFSLLKSNNIADYTDALKFIDAASNLMEIPILSCYDLDFIFKEKLGLPTYEQFTPNLSYTSHNNFDIFFTILILSWFDLEKTKLVIDKLDSIKKKAAKSGFLWIEAEACALLAQLGKNVKANKERSEKIHKQCLTRTITDIVRPLPQWEKQLIGLTNLIKQFNLSKQSQNDIPGSDSQRLIWILDYDDFDKTYDIRPRIQKLTKKNTWTKGRAIALKNLYHNYETMEGLSNQDREICKTISNIYNMNYYYSNSDYFFDFSRTLPALAGHPYIFCENSLSDPVELVEGEPELRLSVKNNKIKLCMDCCQSDYSDDVVVIRETGLRFKFIRFSKGQTALAEFLGEKGLVFPKKTEKKVMDMVADLAPMVTINSDLAVKKDKTSKTIKADPTPNVHIMPWQEGISVEFLVRPFVDTGSYFRPGKGGKNVFAKIKEERVQAIRDLDHEKKLAEQVIKECPSLNLLEEVDSQWLVGDPENALELLLEMKNHKKDLVMSWPRGEKFKVRSTAIFNDLSLSINKKQNWFEINGELKIDKKTALDLEKLMGLLENSPGRFINLDDGTFLAITKTLKERLEELRVYSTPEKKGLKFSPLAVPAIEELIDNAGFLKSDKAWKQHCKKLKNISHMEIPGTLQANLRDYQKTGFYWLSKLAQWNVGACLADDMGIGKTVQALAASLIYAAKGPSLVIAPLSVMANWVEECRVFTPTLNPLVFGPGDRQIFLDDLKPFDLVIASYGLLQTEEEKLSGVDWQTIVLDEAQAIKNMKTKRSRAAMKLKAKFRIITTGTPVENHLYELWTLFNFLNPGLLGSIQNFKNNFIIPIEQNHDKKASRRLRKLIQPFILRRLKTDVLKELPEKTQVTLEVEMSKDEALLYEAQRLRALKEIETADDKPGQKHLRILAQLTRLRQLCCNPALILPDTDIESSKLKIFENMIDELLENKHKVLVFSQFVRHLSILRRLLDKKNISYQYLDGSTSAQKRKKRINAFQNGMGDIFLISLKAGGFGLNLTAADYVIHMDPWWNPAVEDQASDRAHRIGQTRPVTVYRLVAKNTIEEKIIALHKEKRDLADSLLTGSDMAGKMSADELLSLLKDKDIYIR